MDLERKWGGRRDLNPQQPEPQSGALPLSYDHHLFQRAQSYRNLEFSQADFGSRIEPQTITVGGNFDN
jgi:hypothetical protein